jgi:ribosomal protein S30
VRFFPRISLNKKRKLNPGLKTTKKYRKEIKKEKKKTETSS